MGQTLSEPITDKTSSKDNDKRFAYGASAMQGWRLTMEDAHTTLLKLDDTDASFFGVYDGHGGATIAQYTGQVLHKKIRESSHFDRKEYHEALKDGFLSIDKDLSEDGNFAYDPSGCTAVTALVTPDGKILVANAGDSRSVISVKGKSKALSYDHKPVDRAESQRIIAAGGFVEFGRVNGNLALSRAIGDFEFKQNAQLPAEEQIVTCDPDIIEHEMTDDDEFFILACDGIWDCMTNQQAVDFVREAIATKAPLDEICEMMMDHCLAPDSEVGGLGCDNMSIIIIGILNGKSMDEWYESIASRVSLEKPKQDALGNDVTSVEEASDKAEEAPTVEKDVIEKAPVKDETPSS
ncbi:phosphatase 2C-like domain-containing protein [Zychaea mexicana]|uniref:phosphatase 2C-like domain-containing protein n=1 Tax=Zychaea mexicana TaxID=64656 RepID=UPI0022FE8EDD|nr:phosphatase 2C-like domain-containing protein [Zychaea mexicana]KAI9498096.1 phosphatase 2C-like domain-containing protein [Zychaea mexicana]